MSLTASEIIAIRAPDYASDADLTALISFAEEDVDTSFGVFQERAIAMLVLHWMTIRDRGGVTGAVSMEKEGKVSRSYTVSFSEDDFDSTSWGKSFKKYRRMSHPTPMTRAQNWLR